MTSTLAIAREFLERALSQARSREDYHAIGERICEVIEMQELEECRQLHPPTIRTETARRRRRAKGITARQGRENA
jgi:hypothetical protein